jgi:hypothetical protein
MVCHLDRSSHRWFEMKQINDKEVTTVANIVETTWLTRYPWPTMITYDQGTEFMAEFTQWFIMSME